MILVIPQQIVAAYAFAPVGDQNWPKSASAAQPCKAPISDGDAAAIVTYLTAAKGKG